MTHNAEVSGAASSRPLERRVMQQTLDIGFAHDRTTGKEDWLTPPEIVRSLGTFDLDPCTPVVRPWDTAREHYNVMHDGLRQEWFGRVWLNPPYGDKTARWMERLAMHGNGVALIFARTETAAFFPWVWEHATALLFLRGRLNFYTKEGRRGGTAGAPSVLIAYGAANADALAACGIEGKLMHNVELRGRAAGEGPVERSGTNLSAGLGGADIGDSK